MPLAFPSHQGLVAPLWRRWPQRFHVLGLCIGAAMPDVVDGLLGLWRGYLGQWYGHSLIGLVALGVPLGLLLTLLTMRLGRWAQPIGRVPAGLTPLERLAFVGRSVLVGALSHLVSDFISHGNFKWLYPWYENPRLFPSWWYAEWFAVSVPGYREPYPIGPSFVVWLLLSVAGAVLLFWPWLRGTRRV